MLWKRAKRALLPARIVGEILREFRKLHVPLWPIDDLIELALNLALRNGHSAYDSLYVALAVRTGHDLVTADERLYNMLHVSFPNIRRIRDYA
jgi:predicted nucleic acid-binding protein